jgi:hypothetical protein
METIVAPNTDVVRKGMVIRYAINVSHGSSEFSTGGNLNKSSKLPIVSIGVFGTPQMVFTNPIMTIHVHKTTSRPSMNSIATKGYKSMDAENPKGRH